MLSLFAVLHNRVHALSDIRRQKCSSISEENDDVIRACAAVKWYSCDVTCSSRS